MMRTVDVYYLWCTSCSTRSHASCNIRIIMHHALKLRFGKPCPKLDSARLGIFKHPAHEPHVIQRPCRVQNQMEGPKNKERVNEY
jgi:hypothetical protein